MFVFIPRNYEAKGVITVLEQAQIVGFRAFDSGVLIAPIESIPEGGGIPVKEMRKADISSMLNDFMPEEASGIQKIMMRGVLGIIKFFAILVDWPMFSVNIFIKLKEEGE